MKKRRPPVEVRHDWKRRLNRRYVYDCAACGQWTSNLPLYRYDVCPKKDRRKRTADRRGAHVD